MVLVWKSLHPNRLCSNQTITNDHFGFFCDENVRDPQASFVFSVFYNSFQFHLQSLALRYQNLVNSQLFVLQFLRRLLAVSYLPRDLNMNKIIATEDRLSMSIVGPSGCGKSHLIFDMLRSQTFSPEFDKVLRFSNTVNLFLSRMIHEFPKLKFIGSLDFDIIDNLPDNETN